MIRPSEPVVIVSTKFGPNSKIKAMTSAYPKGYGNIHRYPSSKNGLLKADTQW